MKTLIYLLVGLTFTHISNGQVPVHDKHKQRQVEREVFIRWNEFTPKLYFILFHNQYRKGEDRRTIHQYVAMDLVHGQTVNQTEKEKEDLKEVESNNLAYQANIEAELHFNLYFKKLFDKKEKRFSILMAKCITLQVPIENLNQFYEEAFMLQEYLNLIRKDNISPGESQEAMREILADWETLILAIQKTVNLYNISNTVIGNKYKLN